MGLYHDQILPRLTHQALSRPRFMAVRGEVAAGLRGEVLEIGFGTGLNLPLLPSGVRRLHVLEPAHGALDMARRVIDASPIEVILHPVEGTAIPLPDKSVDAVLLTWTLCSLPDQAASLREIRRVLKLGGALHLAEHGLAPHRTLAAWQRRLTPLQQRLAGGCRLDTDVPALLAAGGFDPSELTSRSLTRFGLVGHTWVGRVVRG